MKALWTSILVSGLSFATAAGAGQLEVASGASLDLGGGGLDLGCADLSVAGTLMAGSGGFAAARDVGIHPGGSLDGGSGTLEVAGSWANSGTFTPGTSTVRLVDGCSLSTATVTGNTTFANLELETTMGFQYQFAAGSTQTVTGNLALGGAAGNLLQIRSTVGGSEAFFDLDQPLVGGHYVSVQDNHAIDQPVALGAFSEVLSNTMGWSLSPAAIPALGLVALGVLAASLYLTGRRHLGCPEAGK